MQLEGKHQNDFTPQEILNPKWNANGFHDK